MTEISREDVQKSLDLFNKADTNKEPIIYCNHDATIPNIIRTVLEDRFNQVDRINQAYSERNKVVTTLAKCFPSGTRKTAIEGWDEEWHGCVYIDLPTGQASWHYHVDDAYMFNDLPPYTKEWDGHTTDEKYARMLSMATQPDWKAIAEEQNKTLKEILEYQSYNYGFNHICVLAGEAISKYEQAIKGEK